MVDKKARAIDLKAKSDKEFFLIHGYTGSPTDFNSLPKILHTKFNANVRVIRLKGHGTRVEDLDNVAYSDLYNQIKTELEKDIRKGRKIIIGGVSLGGLFALIFASEYKLKGVFDVCPPYFLRWPFNIPGLGVLKVYRKYWKKTRYREELEERKNSFSYDFMHANALRIVKKASKKLRRNLPEIRCPILSIHSYTDPLGHYKSQEAIQSKVRSPIKKKEMFNTKVHNVFFYMNNQKTYNAIIDFVEKNDLFGKQRKSKVAAVNPSYNEAPRIGKVLDVVSRSKVIDEVIVVDDGSNDNTEEIVKKYRDVKYLKNKKNIGKAGSMERGVSSTDAEIIFFCDADLKGFKEDIIRKIVEPVQRGDFNMFIGLRGNLMQKSVHLFAVNSGERALRRDVWESLPKYFKYKYRVEAGLNYYVNSFYGGFGYKRFNYSQPIKEKKHGFLKGTVQRWSMNLDVLSAYIKDIFLRVARKNNSPFHEKRKN